MKKGEIKSSMNCLERKGGVYSGNSLSILRALSFNGKWPEFVDLMGENLRRTDEGIYVVRHPDYREESDETNEVQAQLTPESFAIYAANYVLGAGQSDSFENLHGEYSQLPHYIGQLAVEIDTEIGAIVYPYETVSDIEVYRDERSLLYSANGNGLFCIQGLEENEQVARRQLGEYLL